MIEKLVDEFSSKCDYVDARVHDIVKETIMLENNDTSNMFLSNKSYGVRVLFKGGWGLVYSYDFTKARSVFEKALKIAKISSGKEKTDFKKPASVKDDKKIIYKIDPFSINPTDKISTLKDYESALKKDPKVKRTSLLMDNARVNKSVYAPGININQEFTINIFRAFVTAREGNVIQSSNKHYSKIGGYETIQSLNLEEITQEILERANRLLNAKAPKPERATVVCDPMMTGLFFHEAVGHACEADHIINKASVLADKRSQLIASEEVNLIDDPTIKERGFYWYDDEGVKAKPTPLITKGRLVGLMHSLKTANQLGEEPTSNGRSMNADYPPIPRMSNTILKPGKWSIDDLIKEVGNGYYVKGFGGGIVDPISGQFSFGASECFKIINGEVSESLRDVTLAGSILKILKGIKVGKDFTKTHLTSTCGKGGQSARVGECCPSILIEDVVIGGSA